MGMEAESWFEEGSDEITHSPRRAGQAHPRKPPPRRGRAPPPPPPGVRPALRLPHAAPPPGQRRRRQAQAPPHRPPLHGARRRRRGARLSPARTPEQQRRPDALPAPRLHGPRLGALPRGAPQGPAPARDRPDGLAPLREGLDVTDVVP